MDLGIVPNSMKYQTKNRETLISFLAGHPDAHFSIRELRDALSEEKKPIPQASLYRLLDELIEEGVVRKYLLENGASCFQYAGDHEAHLHFHLVCQKCGKVIHLECDEVEKLVSHIEEEHGFRIDVSKVNLTGLCASCQEDQ